MGMMTTPLNEHYSVLQNLQSGHSIDPSTIWPTRTGLPHPNPDKKTLLGWELRDQVLDQPLACFFVLIPICCHGLWYKQNPSIPSKNIYTQIQHFGRNLQLKLHVWFNFSTAHYPFFSLLFYFIHNPTLNLVFTTKFCRHTYVTTNMAAIDSLKFPLPLVLAGRLGLGYLVFTRNPVIKSLRLCSSCMFNAHVKLELHQHTFSSFVSKWRCISV